MSTYYGYWCPFCECAVRLTDLARDKNHEAECSNCSWGVQDDLRPIHGSFSTGETIDTNSARLQLILWPYDQTPTESFSDYSRRVGEFLFPDDDDPLIGPSYDDMCAEVERFESRLPDAFFDPATHSLTHEELYPDTGYSFQDLIDDCEAGR